MLVASLCPHTISAHRVVVAEETRGEIDPKQKDLRSTATAPTADEEGPRTACRVPQAPSAGRCCLGQPHITFYVFTRKRRQQRGGLFPCSRHIFMSKQAQVLALTQREFSTRAVDKPTAGRASVERDERV